jgi:hypothetical protein
MRELATKEDLKPGVNWWDVISHRQDWKLNNQACAVTHKIFTDQVTYWEEKKIWFKWRIVPLDYESQTYLIQFHDDTETQDKIKSLTDENKRLKAINNQLITKGLQELREGNNDAR